MTKNEPVSKIMSTDIISVDKTQSIWDVNDIVGNKHVRHVPVVSGETVVGMLSKTDLEKLSFVDTFDGDDLTTAMYDAVTLDQVMTKDLITVQQNETIHHVAEILSENEFHALPVLNGEKLVGIVTTTDLIKYLLNQFWIIGFEDLILKTPISW